MTQPARTIDEALAFFQLFADGAWKSCHVRTPALEIFVSREVGLENPLAKPPALIAADKRVTLGAPHLGTLTELAPVGTLITAGGPYGTLSLLEDRIELIADEAGVVVDHLAAISSLVEYDQALVALS